MLVVLGTAAFTACSDDDDNNGGNGNENKRMVKRIYLKDNPGYKGYDFFYDELREKSDRNEIKRRTKSLLFDWWFC